MKRQLLTLLTFFVCLSAMAGETKTYYSKVTVSAATATGDGTVYVSKSRTDTPAYAATSEASQDASDKSHTYYLYARPIEGKTFLGWFDGKNSVSSDAETEYVVTATSENSSAPTTKNLTAYFGDQPAVRVSANMTGVGTVAIDKLANQVGDEVTLTATLSKVPNYGCRNLMIDFVGWRNEKGEIVSRDMTYTFTVEAPADIEAVFRNKNSLKEKGYFRVRNIFNRVLSIEGNYKYQSVGSSGNYLDGLLHWRCPDDLVKSDFANKSWNATDDDPGVDVESMPSTVIYISGSNLDVDAAPDQSALGSVNAFGQGTDTKTMTGQTLTVKTAIATCPGYYILYGGLTAGLKMTHREGDEDRDGDGINDGHFMYCSPLLGRCKYDDPYSWMAIQPIDEEHFDEFWFGAAADEAMQFDGGYWTSMYTGFPYECRDGVEAYYAHDVAQANGISYIQITKIESGIVPAYSAVLLKCQGTRSRQNRLMPLDFDGDYPALEGNLLTGVFQLYTDKDGNGRVPFDESSMRVFSVDGKGELGFYKLAAQADGTPAELKANKAYLDLSKLPQTVSGPMRISIDNNGISGVSDVCADRDDSVDSAVYDLYGRRVTDLRPGTIYIRNGKKFIHK